MPKSSDELRERLLRAGVAPRHVRRYLTELADHLADMRAEEELAGRSRAEAECAALIRLGGIDDLAKAMIERPQFQSWCARAPWATFGLAPLFLGWGLRCCPFYLVVWMEDVSAGCRYSFCPNSWVRDFLFWRRQVDLFRCSNSHRLGSWTHRRPSKIQGGLAHCRFRPNRIDRRNDSGSRESLCSPRRIRTHQHGLHSWAYRFGRSIWPIAWLADLHAHGAAVYHLANSKPLFLLGLRLKMHHKRPKRTPLMIASEYLSESIEQSRHFASSE